MFAPSPACRLKKSFAALATVATLFAASPAAQAAATDCAALNLSFDQCFAGLVRRPAANPSFEDVSIGQLQLGALSSLIGSFSTPGLTLSSVSLWSQGAVVAVDDTLADGISFGSIAAGNYKVQLSGLVTGPKLQGGKFGAYAGGFTVTPVPEPETYALFGAGLLAVLLMSRRRNDG